MRTTNIKLILSYDGTRYHGWQRQKNGLSIQEVVESKIQVMVREKVSLIASGRTDAGVHAVGQVCNFTTTAAIPPEAIKKGLNSMLPDDILVREAESVPPGFHARYSAKNKTYVYEILNRAEPDVFRRSYLWHIRRPLDVEKMKRRLARLKGTHDFSSFRSSGSGNVNPVRSISRVELHGPEEGLISIAMTADGFLRHMVRNIVGTVVEVGLGKLDEEAFEKILDMRDRRAAGFKAPPQGLYLVEVRYAEDGGQASAGNSVLG